MTNKNFQAIVEVKYKVPITFGAENISAAIVKIEDMVESKDFDPVDLEVDMNDMEVEFTGEIEGVV